MTERPILFSGPMVRSILEGRKTMTRRVVKPQPECGKLVPGVDSFGGEPAYWLPFELPGLRPEIGVRDKIRCPYGRPGDLLWVRETWIRHGGALSYKADGDWIADYRSDYPDDRGFPWRPSIHMPRWASRLTLRVTAVRVERLQEISEEDARTEGCEAIPIAVTDGPYACGGGSIGAREVFMKLWDTLNAKRAPWASNPWVWVVSFART